MRGAGPTDLAVSAPMPLEASSAASSAPQPHGLEARINGDWSVSGPSSVVRSGSTAAAMSALLQPCADEIVLVLGDALQAGERVENLLDGEQRMQAIAALLQHLRAAHLPVDHDQHVADFKLDGFEQRRRLELAVRAGDHVVHEQHALAGVVRAVDEACCAMADRESTRLH